MKAIPKEIKPQRSARVSSKSNEIGQRSMSTNQPKVSYGTISETEKYNLQKVVQKLFRNQDGEKVDIVSFKSSEEITDHYDENSRKDAIATDSFQTPARRPNS